MGINPIPAHTKFCHKNYFVAEQLVNKMFGLETEVPFGLTENQWSTIQELFEEYFNGLPEETEGGVWDTVEGFFTDLIKKMKDGVKSSSKSEKQAIASLDTDDDSDNEGKSSKSALDLSQENRDPKKKTLEEKALGLYDGLDKDKKSRYDGIIDAALEEAVTRKDASEGKLNYKKYRVGTANLRDYSRVNEKSNFHPAFRTLGLYRAINNELTTMKPTVENPAELYILIDDSGSMSNGNKEAIVYRTLLKAKQMAKKEGIKTVLIFPFESSLYRQSFDLLKETPEFGFNKGGTDIQESLEALFERIGGNKDQTILIINDGEDQVSASFTPPCKVVTLTLFQHNSDLEAAALRSGGKYFEV